MKKLIDTKYLYVLLDLEDWAFGVAAHAYRSLGRYGGGICFMVGPFSIDIGV